jgi:hypothetical protein
MLNLKISYLCDVVKCYVQCTITNCKQCFAALIILSRSFIQWCYTRFCLCRNLCYYFDIDK